MGRASHQVTLWVINPGDCFETNAEEARDLLVPPQSL